jgi:hypothetical protein
MIHSIRWTLPKIERYVKVIDHLVYRRCALIPPFRCSMLTDRVEHLPVGTEVDDSSWEMIKPLAHWGRSSTDFVLRSSFTIPADWPQDADCALELSLGEAGDFSHPEALIYVDGMAYATCDRHHQEVRLRADWHDGSSHTLALHLWTGLGDSNYLDGLAQTGGLAYDYLLMQPAKIVQIDQPTRDFIASVRVIPSCVLRSHSEMGKIRHRTKKLLIIFKLQQLVTKSISNGLKRGKSTVIKGFFPSFLPDMFNGVQFGTIGRLWDQTNSFWNDEIFGAMPSSLIYLNNKKVF